MIYYVAARHAPWPGSVTPSNPSPINTDPEEKLQDWLQEVGLEFNPFLPLDASEDSRLSTYLVGHEAFADLWGDWSAILLAPAGGGKTAFRVRLAYACRAGEDGRAVFPIVYRFPHGPLTWEAHLEAIGRAAAHELLLTLAWRPGLFERLGQADRQEVHRAIEWNAPGLLDQLLPQIRRVGSPKPIVQLYDLSAGHLPNPPSPERVRALCDDLQALPLVSSPPSPSERFDHLRSLLSKLGYQAVYLLVDDVDAHKEVQQDLRTGLKWLRPLLENAPTLEERGVYLKLFLPQGFEIVREDDKLLTSQTKFVKIEWARQQLVQMLQSRVRVASKGEFHSLDAVSNPALHHLEETLAEQAHNPRALLDLSNTLLLAHVRREKPGALLDEQDLASALELYG